MAHTGPAQLQVLIDSIQHPLNHIYLMVDRRSHLAQFLNIKSQVSPLHFCRKRTRVRWGGVSMVKNEINLFREALAGGSYTRLHLLSGVDMPLRSQDFIHNFFNLPENRTREFISIASSDPSDAVLAKKIRHRHYFVGGLRSSNRFYRKLCTTCHSAAVSLQAKFGLTRSWPWPTMAYGSNWCSITPRFAQYIIDHENKTLQAFRHAYTPDEVYKQTLILNSPFAQSLSPVGNLRAIDWTRGNPYTFKSVDIPKLLLSENLFARKFSPQSAAGILSHLGK